MNEREPALTPEIRPATEGVTPDWRRLEVAARRFGPMIADGIAQALAEGTEIDHETARCVAHVLGRAYGRESALASFGRTGEGHYLTMRDEYLALYADDQADAVTKEIIDWIGSHLVARERIGSGRRFLNEHLPPKLNRILVRAEVETGDARCTVHVPADWDTGKIRALGDVLGESGLAENDALRAFLTLPDVNAGSPDLLESFADSHVASYSFLEEAVRELGDLDSLEQDVRALIAERALPEAAVTVEYAVIEDRVRDVYDIVAEGWRFHAFAK